MEVVKALVGEEARRAVVKVRVKLVDDTLEAQDGEEARGEGCRGS